MMDKRGPTRLLMEGMVDAVTGQRYFLGSLILFKFSEDNIHYVRGLVRAEKKSVGFNQLLKMNNQKDVIGLQETNIGLVDDVWIEKYGRRVSDDDMKFSKLDRFLLNEEFSNMWGNLSVVALDRKLPDHCPIGIKDVDLNFRPRPFRVFNIWLEEPHIGQVVEGAWNKEVKNRRPDCRFRDKLKNVKEELRKWSKERFGALKEKIEVLKKEVMRWELETENRSLNEKERVDWLGARKLWMEKDNDHSSMLLQKARVLQRLEDRWRWMLHEGWNFTMKELSRLVEEKILRLESDTQKTLWNKLVP
ncbi:hypothetical protein Tco_0651485 [Tanacetum coccineum]|uniref:Uncharacterized protein n=1 Tax=Tanacetum coccineum TaxID=301880 RepID=A0ABQ4WVL3_9ASTR